MGQYVNAFENLFSVCVGGATHFLPIAYFREAGYATIIDYMTAADGSKTFILEIPSRKPYRNFQITIRKGIDINQLISELYDVLYP
jgi:hypothetical protein